MIVPAEIIPVARLDDLRFRKRWDELTGAIAAHVAGEVDQVALNRIFGAALTAAPLRIGEVRDRSLSEISVDDLAHIGGGR